MHDHWNIWRLYTSSTWRIMPQNCNSKQYPYPALEYNFLSSRNIIPTWLHCSKTKQKMRSLSVLPLFLLFYQMFQQWSSPTRLLKVFAIALASSIAPPLFSFPILTHKNTGMLCCNFYWEMQIFNDHHAKNPHKQDETLRLWSVHGKNINLWLEDIGAPLLSKCLSEFSACLPGKAIKSLSLGDAD